MQVLHIKYAVYLALLYIPQAMPLSFCWFAALSCHVTEVTLSNGLEWSLDDTTMYYIDSIPGNVYSFKYDASSGQITDKKVIIDYTIDKSLGLPDGMCVDSQGKLWIASFDDGCHPARRITSCCFGGSDLVDSMSLVLPMVLVMRICPSIHSLELYLLSKDYQLMGYLLLSLIIQKFEIHSLIYCLNFDLLSA